MTSFKYILFICGLVLVVFAVDVVDAVDVEWLVVLAKMSVELEMV